ncbi:hypothetical protein IFR10_09430 [Bacillus sp. CFBP 13597]|nr:hypothetical protein [Bacillus sp. CFBP 13597]
MTDKQLKATIDDENTLVLTESRTMRDQHVYRDEVLEKVKIIPTLPNSLELTTEMVASYYEVPGGTIKTILTRHRDEFNQYEEIRILKGKPLLEFKRGFQDETLFKGANSLSLINRRGLLRIGMLLTESEIAQSIRNYLLNVEEISEKAQKEWALEREISKRDRRRLTDAIQNFYEGKSMKGHEYNNFTNLVYKTLFNMNSTQLKSAYELERTDSLRDAMTTEDLRKVVEVEQVVTSLIRLGRDYKEIKDELESKADRFQ